MSKFKVGDRVQTPFGVGSFIEELEDLGWGLSIVQFGNSKGSHYGFELQIRNEDLELYKTPHERLLELGWLIDKDDTNPANLEFYYKNNKVLIIDKALKVVKTLYAIDLQLAEILVDYLKELENENNR